MVKKQLSRWSFVNKEPIEVDDTTVWGDYVVMGESGLGRNYFTYDFTYDLEHNFTTTNTLEPTLRTEINEDGVMVLKIREGTQWYTTSIELTPDVGPNE
tara:strand:+ start:111 stop:407 length:297 start_codon:yes stop_codon:yes gene_type:complete